MFEKIKKYYNKPYLRLFSDVRNIGTVAFGVIALLVTWNSVKVVQTNYGLQKQISAMQQANGVQELINNNLKLKNQYFDTDAYLELAARRYFNKALPGERLVIVPKAVAEAHSVALSAPKTLADSVAEADKASGNGLQRNFNAWLDFMFHRQTD